MIKGRKSRVISVRVRDDKYARIVREAEGYRVSEWLKMLIDVMIDNSVNASKEAKDGIVGDD